MWLPLPALTDSHGRRNALSYILSIPYTTYDVHFAMMNLT